MRSVVWQPGPGSSATAARNEAWQREAGQFLRGPVAPTIVVGLGSPLAGDDGAGMVVARIVRRRLWYRGEVKVVTLGWGGLRLMEVLRGWGRAILVDAIDSAGRYPAGTVLRLSAEDVAGSARLNSCHDLGLSASMAFGRMLGWHLPEVVEVYAIEVQSVERCTRRLSHPVQAGVRVLADGLTAMSGSEHEVPVEAGLTRC